MRPSDRLRARHIFVQQNGVDPWAKEGSAIRTFFGVTGQFCGFVFDLAGVLSVVLFLGAIMGAL